MAGVTYSCPNCGSYLAFNPDLQKWKCNSCGSIFDEQTLLKRAAEYQQQAEQQKAAEHAHEAPAPEPAQPEQNTGSQVVYHCPACGSEIITDETTVATSCYYCHNPVVLEGKLTADMKPDQVLPFSISEEKAVDGFLKWVSKKRFVPKGFFARDQIKQMEGVYYPHFISDCIVDGTYEGEGRRSTVVDTGRDIITTTEHYAVHRRGMITFQNVMRPALKSEDRKLSDGIHPFPLEDVKPFSGAYLAGFVAERRDMTEDEATADVESELTNYVTPLLTESVHYNSVSGSSTASLVDKECRYTLLPTWVLTYVKTGQKVPYYYAMNGRTGEVCGKLPLNKTKLRLWGLGLAAGCFILYCAAAYFLF